MLASPIFWQAPLAKKRLKKTKQKKRFRIPQPKFSQIPESGFPYMVRVAHLTVNECFGSLCFDTNTPAFLMQIVLKNSEKKINIIFIRNQKGVYQNKINFSLAATLPRPQALIIPRCKPVFVLGSRGLPNVNSNSPTYLACTAANQPKN